MSSDFVRAIFLLEEYCCQRHLLKSEIETCSTNAMLNNDLVWLLRWIQLLS